MPQPHSTQGLSPGGGLCVVFWDKAIYFHRASFHLGMRMGTRSIKKYNTPVSPSSREKKSGQARRLPTQIYLSYRHELQTASQFFGHLLITFDNLSFLHFSISLPNERQYWTGASFLKNSACCSSDQTLILCPEMQLNEIQCTLWISNTKCHFHVTSYYFTFDRIVCFGEFLGKRTLCDAYHKACISLNPNFWTYLSNGRANAYLAPGRAMW